MPRRLKPWLTSQDSLTQRLKTISQSGFSVELLFQGVARVQLSERNLLKLKARQGAQVREVLLKDGDRALVYARSVLPLKSLGRRLKPLHRLAQKPMGEFLFKQRDLRRSAIEVTEISHRDNYLPEALRLADFPYWGRRSVFSLSDRQLLVSEVFLTQNL